jgi:hypothetical protein
VRQHRLLPGLLEGASACTDCTGIPSHFRCTRCGREDEPVRTGFCAHCCLADDLTTLLDDGTGTIAAPLRPLFTALTSQKNARNARIWLTVNPQAEQLLRDIAQGRVPLTHETFRDHPSASKVAFLRALCIEHQLLEPVNLDIEGFHTWLQTKIGVLPGQDALLIRQYARWTHLHRMRHLESTGALKKGTFLDDLPHSSLTPQGLHHADSLPSRAAAATHRHIIQNANFPDTVDESGQLPLKRYEDTAAVVLLNYIYRWTLITVFTRTLGDVRAFSNQWGATK